jgi:hypothetical protein
VNCAKSRVMTDANGRLVLHEHKRHRLAEDVAGAHDNDILAFERDIFVLEKFEHAVGRAMRENRAADADMVRRIRAILNDVSNGN